MEHLALPQPTEREGASDTAYSSIHRSPKLLVLQVSRERLSVTIDPQCDDMIHQSAKYVKIVDNCSIK